MTPNILRHIPHILGSAAYFARAFNESFYRSIKFRLTDEKYAAMLSKVNECTTKNEAFI